MFTDRPGGEGVRRGGGLLGGVAHHLHAVVGVHVVHGDGGGRRPVRLLRGGLRGGGGGRLAHLLEAEVPQGAHGGGGGWPVEALVVVRGRVGGVRLQVAVEELEDALFPAAALSLLLPGLPPFFSQPAL